MFTPAAATATVLPGLRALQGRKQLQELVSFVKTARDNLDWGPSGPPPLLVKVAPDLTDADKADIAAVVMDTGVDGLVVSNTTISRPGVLGVCVAESAARQLAAPALPYQLQYSLPLSSTIMYIGSQTGPDVGDSQHPQLLHTCRN